MKRLLLSLLLFILGSSASAQFRDVLEQIRPAAIRWGGYTGALDIHPRNANELFAGSGPGELYRTTDGGAHWRFVDTFPGRSVVYVSYCPRDPNVILVTSPFDTRTERGSGIWRSEDGGVTWTQPPTSIPPMTDRCPNRAGAAGISWQPGSDTVWVATDCGLQRSDDRGETWRQIIVDPTAAGGYDVWDSRFRPDRLFAVLALDAYHVIAGGESGYYYMHDGIAWHRSEGAPPNVYCPYGLTASPANPRLLFRADYDSAYLQSSVDQGITWRRFPVPDLDAGNMPAFVRTVPRAGSTTDFELYFGTGVNLKRAVIPYDTRLWGSVRFETLALDHTDPGAIVFHPDTHRPLVIVGDFGVMNTVDDGRTWHMIGAGPSGHNALNALGLGVQSVRSRLRSDISFITWHNDTWLSRDSGATWAIRGPVEGVAVQASGPDLRDDSEAFISLSPWGGSQRLYSGDLTRDVTDPTPRADACWRHYAFFRNPADGRQNILAVAYGCEGQNAIYDRRAADETTWHEVARVNPSGGMAGFPRVAVSGGTVTLYHAFGAPDGRVLLARTANAHATGSVTFPTMNGFGSLAQNFNGAEPVFAVKPDDERVLIGADVSTMTMMRSINGGDDWTPMPELTTLVTDGGRLRFVTGGQSQVSVIAFNPFNANVVVAGTMAAGLFQSSDGGTTWRAVPGSERIRNITAIAFDRNRATYITGNGHGIWRWRVTFDFVFLDLSRILFERLMVADPMTGAVVPIDIIGDPDRCPACTLLLAQAGEIRSLRNDPKLGLVVGATEPQMLATIALKEPQPLTLTLPENGFQEQCPTCSDLQAKGLFVRGLLFSDGKLRAVLASKEKEWQLTDAMLLGAQPQPVAITANLTLEGVKHGPGFDYIETGETIAMEGSGFEPDSVVDIILNGRKIDTAKTDAKGGFATKVVLNTIPGQGHIAAVQKGQKLITARRDLFVGNRDK